MVQLDELVGKEILLVPKTPFRDGDTKLCQKRNSSSRPKIEARGFTAQ